MTLICNPLIGCLTVLQRLIVGKHHCGEDAVVGMKYGAIRVITLGNSSRYSSAANWKTRQK